MAELRLAPVLVAIHVLEDLAADRLDEVGGRLLRAEQLPLPQPDEGLEPGEESLEEDIDGDVVALGGAFEEGGGRGPGGRSHEED